MKTRTQRRAPSPEETRRTESPSRRDERASDRKLIFVTVVVALLLRIGYIVLFHTYEFSSGDKYLMGYETGAIARSIASGHGFSSPFRTASGPSAWLAPLYPYFVAGVFKIFGIYSSQSAFVIFAVNSLLSALTCIPMLWVARRLLGRKVALASAWIWALAPPAMFWAVRWVWETSASALLLTWLIWLTLTLADSERIQSWLWFGVLWGVAALTNPSLLSFFPISLAYPLWQRRSRGHAWASRGAIVVLLFLNLITPWLIRNAVVFHYPVFIRPNLWAEVSFGNGSGADGTWQARLHPSMNPRENASYDLMGEVQYVQWKKIQVTQFIRSNPGLFLKLCARRIYLFWSGYSQPGENLRWLRATAWLLFTALAFAGLWIAWRNRIAGIAPLAWLLLLYPAAYYVTFAFARYKHPIEPVLVILAVYSVSAKS
jgi:4-amino-4-deoxy-L-arabinose transferase-like glycosyltransferase